MNWTLIYQIYLVIKAGNAEIISLYSPGKNDSSVVGFLHRYII